MMYLRRSIGICIQDERLEIQAAGKTLTGSKALGNLTIDHWMAKEPLMLKSEIQGFLQRHRINPDHVVASLCPDQVMSGTLSLPAEAEESLAQAVNLQLLNITPYDPEEVYAERIVRKGENGKLEVDLHVIRRDRVQQLLDRFRAAGLVIRQITLSAFAFQQLLEADNHTGTCFLLDLEATRVSIYIYRQGRFACYLNVPGENGPPRLDMVLRELEQAARLVRCGDDEEIEVLANVAAAGWIEPLADEKYAFIKPLGGKMPAGERSGKDLKALAAAMLALDANPRDFNLIPADWREKSSLVGLVVTYVLAGILLLLVGLTFVHPYIQETSFEEKLDRHIAELQKDYSAVQQLRVNIQELKKRAEVYRQVLQRPRSDLQILRDLTEKAGPKTYFNEYLRDSKLTIGGYTDSSLELQSRLSTIPYLKNPTMQGSITKNREGLEHFRFEIQLAEEEK